MIIAIDNNVLIHLVTDTDLSGNLVTFLYQNNATLLIPTPVLAEFLAYDFNLRRTTLLASAHSKAIKGVLNEKAALICGDLGYKLDNEFSKGKKQKIKVDLQIIAIAIAERAKFILSEDDDISDMVEKLKLPLTVLSRHQIKLGCSLFDS